MVKRNNFPRDKVAQEFGIQVMEQLVLCEARVLPPPVVYTIAYDLEISWIIVFPSFQYF